MSEVTCLICNKTMKDRINGSHLKRKHNIDISEYVKMFPDADLGKYRCNNFKCKICNIEISGVIETVLKHLRDEHKILDIDSYYKEYTKKYCKCGCGNICNYSYAKHEYLDYVHGHSEVWNKGLTAKDSESLRRVSIATKNRIRKPESIEKTRLGLIEWYNNPENKKEQIKKTKEAILEKYGVENPFSSDIIKQKIKQTCLERYGCEYVMQNDDIAYKSFINAKKYDKHIDLDGTVCFMQGFDKIGFEYLLTKYDESDIVVNKKLIPKIFYIFDNKNRKYFPDFYIKSINTLVEIKSDYLYEKYIDKNNAKFKSCIDNNFNLLLLVFNKNKKLTINKLYESKKY